MDWPKSADQDDNFDDAVKLNQTSASENEFSSAQSSQTTKSTGISQEDGKKLRTPLGEISNTFNTSKTSESQTTTIASIEDDQIFSWSGANYNLEIIDSFPNFPDLNSQYSQYQEEEEWTLQKSQKEDGEAETYFSGDLSGASSLEQSSFFTPEFSDYSIRDTKESIQLLKSLIEQDELSTSEHSTLNSQSSSSFSASDPIFTCSQRRQPKENKVSSYISENFSSHEKENLGQNNNNETKGNSKCADSVNVRSEKAQDRKGGVRNQNLFHEELSPFLISSEVGNTLAPKSDLLGVNERTENYNRKTCFEMKEVMKKSEPNLNCQNVYPEMFPVTEQSSFPTLNAIHMHGELCNDEFGRDRDEEDVDLNKDDKCSVKSSYERENLEDTKGSNSFNTTPIQREFLQQHQNLLSSQRDRFAYTAIVPFLENNENYSTLSSSSNVQKDEYKIQKEYQSVPNYYFSSFQQIEARKDQSKEQPLSMTITPRRIQRIHSEPYLLKTPTSTSKMFSKPNLSPVGHKSFPSLLPINHSSSSPSNSCSSNYAEKNCDNSPFFNHLPKFVSQPVATIPYLYSHNSPTSALSSPTGQRPSSSGSGSWSRSSFQAPSVQGSEMSSPSPSIKRKFSPVRSSVIMEKESSPPNNKFYSKYSSEINSPTQKRNQFDSDTDETSDDNDFEPQQKKVRITVVGAYGTKVKESCERTSLEGDKGKENDTFRSDQEIDEESESMECACVLMSLGQRPSDAISIRNIPANSNRAKRAVKRASGRFSSENVLERSKEGTKGLKKEKNTSNRIYGRNRQREISDFTPAHRPFLSKTGIRSFPSYVSKQNGQESMLKEYPMFYRRFPVSTMMEEETRFQIFGISKIEDINKIQDEELRQAAMRSFKKVSSASFKQPESLLDLYTARYTRGIGNGKEGLCPICYEEGCSIWLKTKTSQYNYHLTVQHGISPRTKLPMDPPIAFQTVQKQVYNDDPKSMRQGKCHACKQFIDLESIRDGSVNVPEIYFWKHAKQCHDRYERLEETGDFFVENEFFHRVVKYEQEQERLLEAY